MKTLAEVVAAFEVGPAEGASDFVRWRMEGDARYDQLVTVRNDKTGVETKMRLRDFVLQVAGGGRRDVTIGKR
jgi:hypothetical protein